MNTIFFPDSWKPEHILPAVLTLDTLRVAGATEIREEKFKYTVGWDCIDADGTMRLFPRMCSLNFLKGVAGVYQQAGFTVKEIDYENSRVVVVVPEEMWPKGLLDIAESARRRNACREVRV